jgi:hypothetical protein
VAVISWGFVGPTGNRPLLPLSEHQKFVIFSKCLENSKNFCDYYNEVVDHEYQVTFFILWRCCGQIKFWAVGQFGRLGREPPEYSRVDLTTFAQYNRNQVDYD